MSHLSGGAGDGQVSTVLAEVDLLDAQAGVVAVGVETAHLQRDSSRSEVATLTPSWSRKEGRKERGREKTWREGGRERGCVCGDDVLYVWAPVERHTPQTLLTHTHAHTHLPEGGPLSLGALVHVVVGVGVGVEHPCCAQLVHGVQTHARRVPETNRPVLVSAHTHTQVETIKDGVCVGFWRCAYSVCLRVACDVGR